MDVSSDFSVGAGPSLDALDEKLCEPCQMLLRGDKMTELNIKKGPHHLNAESFQRALQLPCVLCSLAWNRAEESRSLHTQPSITRYQMFSINGKSSPNHPDIRMRYQLRFVYTNSAGEEFTQSDIALVPEKSMFSQYRVVEPGSINGLLCISKYQISESLSENTGSNVAIQFLSDRYKHCLKQHAQCATQQFPTSFHPTRLIDVGTVDDDCIRLQQSYDPKDDRPYFCLSHCWGQKQPYKLTKETETTLLEGLPIKELPKTFRESIYITRACGVRFLWIDSLCIFQDNLDDWEGEASHMREVYSQAACTIAATAAKDSGEGLFFGRNPELLRPRRVYATWSPNRQENGELDSYLPGEYWCDHYETWTDCVENAPLNSRAWVAQERHLSPRIMHFTATQLFWECHAGKSNETYPEGLPYWGLPAWFDDSSALKRKLHLFRQQHRDRESQGAQITDPEHLSVDDLYHAWAVFRITYSTRRLTKGNDKLVALSGIAKDFGDVSEDELVAGLWKNRLIEELCWLKLELTSDSFPKVTKWRAPSWSWASTNNRAWMSNTYKFHRKCSNREIWAEVDNLDVKARVSGELERALLRVRCRLFQATFTCNLEPDRLRNLLHQTILLNKSNIELDSREQSHHNSVTLQLDDSSKLETKNHAHLFIIQRCAHEIEGDSSPEKDVVEGLMLEPVPGSTGAFKRLGTFTALGKDTVAKIIEEHWSASSVVITLV